MCLPTILPVLCDIFNASLQSGVFPGHWKWALVRPLPKKKPPLDASHLRPISLLSAASKLLESVALKQMKRFINERDILDSHQSGFREYHSTHTALIDLVDGIREAIDVKDVVLMVAIDFSRAFDLVNINLLIDKLKLYGFSDQACLWIGSFLSRRPQTVVGPLGERSSRLCRVQGVPQGSLSGPLLFSIFINDLPLVCRHTKHHLYADDFTITCRGPADRPDLIVKKMNDDLARIARWAEENGLTINTRKTQAIWFGSRRYIRKIHAVAIPPIRLCDETLNPDESIKVLGCVLDETLSWREHTNYTGARCFVALARLRRVGDFLPRGTRLMLVRALVFPHLDYGAGLMAGLSGELLIRLQRCRNAAVRFVTGVRRHEHITPSYVELRILKLGERRSLLVVCLLANILRRGAPAYLAARFTFESGSGDRGSRRSNLDLSIPFARLSCLQSAFFINAANLWNALPHEMRVLYRSAGFGRIMRQYYLRNDVKNSVQLLFCFVLFVILFVLLFDNHCSS
uniref:Reverse transcriptase domain-containing protein n=1 Tax=Trichogramma kaykai TaxID=54128 RepID=A0ABD2W2M0_9HYME